MSVLETFYILFESDADGVKKGAEEAFKTTDNLEKKLKTTDHISNKLGSSFHGMALAATGALASLLSVGALVGSVFRYADIADKLDDTSTLLGRSAEELSNWGDAAAISGGSAEAFQGTLKGLSASLATLDATGKSRVAPFFKEMGISLTDGRGKAKDTLDLLLEVADKFETMDKQSIVGFGRKLGLDEGTILLLMQGRRGVEDIIRRQKELGTITKEQTEIANKYNDQIEEMGHVFRTIGLSIAEVVLPPLTKFLKAIADGFIYLRTHESLLKALGTGFKVLAGIILAYVLPSLAAMAASVLAATWPFILAGAAILTFIAILEDLYAFMDGKPSLLGDLLKDAPRLEIAVRALIAALQDLWTAFEPVLNPLQNLKDMGGQVLQYLINGKQSIAAADSNPLAAQTSTSIAAAGATNNRTNSIKIDKIEVQTQATDADGISRQIGKSLQEQVTMGISNYDDGIAR